MRRPPDEAFAVVRDTDPDVLDGGELDEYVGAISQLRAWCDAREVLATRRQRQLAAEGRAAQPEHALARRGRHSAKNAKAAADRERVCAAMPGFEDALAEGTVSTGHVDAIAGATRGLDEGELAEFVSEVDDLLTDAARQGVDGFARGCRDLARSIRSRHHARADAEELERQRQQSKVTRWVDQVTGMHKTLIECDRVTDRAIWSAVQRARGRLRRRSQQTGGPRPRWDRLTVDAFVDAVNGGHAGAGAVVAHIDLRSLVDGLHDHGLCETDSGVSLPVETVRRMACDAGIIPVVLDGDGVVLDEGRAKRLATAEQRLAIQAMQATCSHPDCTVGVDDCLIHHLDPWGRAGRSDVDRLAPLCEPHHHLVHEGGWTFAMTPDRVATWVRPDGEEYWTGSINDRRRPAG